MQPKINGQFITSLSWHYCTIANETYFYCAGSALDRHIDSLPQMRLQP
jgi:hypothetical protein